MVLIRRRDTPPEPFTDDELSVISLAKGSFPYFLEHVYPLSFTGRLFRMADGERYPFSLSPMHYDWAAAAETYDRICFQAARGHLKSTVLNHGFSFWKLFRAEEDVDGYVISYKQDLAEEHTEKIRAAVASNPYTRFWIDRKRSAESLVDYEVRFAAGADGWHGTIDPFGVLTAMRGMHPSFVICDDILSDFANPLQPTQIKRIDAVFRSSIESMPDEGNSLLVIGTPQSYEDTLFRLRTNPQYIWARYPAEYQIEVEGGYETKFSWPEKYDKERLARTRSRVGSSAYQVEYLLVPAQAVNAFLPRAVIERVTDPNLVAWPLNDPWPGQYPVYGGMDVGKEVHPTHISLGVLMPTGDIVQCFEMFLDHLDYRQQVGLVNQLIQHFSIKRFYYDSTRAELDDRGLSPRALGIKFNAASKVLMAKNMELRFYNDPGEKGIVLLPGARQTSQIVSVDKFLKSVETREGHGDAFWSVALMVKAAEDGPMLSNLGNAQDVFGGHRRPLPEALSAGV